MLFLRFWGLILNAFLRFWELILNAFYIIFEGLSSAGKPPKTGQNQLGFVCDART